MTIENLRFRCWEGVWVLVNKLFNRPNFEEKSKVKGEMLNSQPPQETRSVLGMYFTLKGNFNVKNRLKILVEIEDYKFFSGCFVFE